MNSKLAQRRACNNVTNLPLLHQQYYITPICIELHNISQDILHKTYTTEATIYAYSLSNQMFRNPGVTGSFTGKFHTAWICDGCNSCLFDPFSTFSALLLNILVLLLHSESARIVHWCLCIHIPASIHPALNCA